MKGTLHIAYHDYCTTIPKKILAFKNVKSYERAKQIVDSRTRTEKGKTPANIKYADFVTNKGEKREIKIMQ